jgi:hypothetical protein
MHRKMFILGRMLSIDVYDLYKFREKDWSPSLHVMKFLCLVKLLINRKAYK